jgi:hypothetical protein
MASPTHILINSYTVGAGTTSTVTFSSIPNTYTDLLIHTCARTNSTNYPDFDVLTFNGSSSNFSYKYLQGNGLGGSLSAGSGTGAIGGLLTTANTGMTTGVFSSTEYYIPNYASNTNKKYSMQTAMENNTASNTYQELAAVTWANTSAITSVTLTTTGGSFVQYSTFYLYGIKNN